MESQDGPRWMRGHSLARGTFLSTDLIYTLRWTCLESQVVYREEGPGFSRREPILDANPEGGEGLLALQPQGGSCPLLWGRGELGSLIFG